MRWARWGLVFLAGGVLGAVVATLGGGRGPRREELSYLESQLELAQARLATAQEERRVAHLRALMLETLRTVEEERGLRARELPGMRLIDDAGVCSFVDREIERQYPGDALDSYAAVLELLGLVPRGTDLRELFRRLYAEQAAAIYDPQEKVMLVRGDLGVSDSLLRVVLAHELTHALQDEHFPLVSGLFESRENDDRVLAWLCVAEGDATQVMGSFYVESLSTDLLMDLVGLRGMQAELEAAPGFVQKMLVFPYYQGSVFLAEVGAAGKEKDEIFRTPPDSTEQVMHPERYLGGDGPTPVEWSPASVVPDLPVVYENTLGEFGCREWLSLWVGAAEAAGGAEGWDGDRYWLVREEGTGAEAVVWLSLWDDEAEAGEFARTASRSPAYVGRHGTRVLCVVGDEALVPRIASAVGAE